MLPVGLFGVTRTMALIFGSVGEAEAALCFSRSAVKALVLGKKEGAVVSRGKTLMERDVSVISWLRRGEKGQQACPHTRYLTSTLYALEVPRRGEDNCLAGPCQRMESDAGGEIAAAGDGHLCRAHTTQVPLADVPRQALTQRSIPKHRPIAVRLHAVSARLALHGLYQARMGGMARHPLREIQQGQRRRMQRR